MYFDFIDFSNNSSNEIMKKQLNPSFYTLIKLTELAELLQSLIILRGHHRALVNLSIKIWGTIDPLQPSSDGLGDLLAAPHYQCER